MSYIRREPALLIGLHTDHHLASHSLSLSAHASLPQGLSLPLPAGGGTHAPLTHAQPSERHFPAPLSPKPELFADDRLPDSDAASSQDQAAAKKRRRPSGNSGDGRAAYPVPQESKACAQCHVVKPAAQFHRNRSKPCGLGSWCKDCMTKWYNERPTHTPSVQEKLCSSCKVVKPASEFHRQSRLPTGLRIYCKGCETLRHKQKPRAVEEPLVAAQACSGCHAIKAAADFPRKRNSPTGLHSLCKPCHAATHPPKPKPEGQPARRCSRCGGERGSRQGRGDGAGGKDKDKGGPASWCKGCVAAAATSGEGAAAGAGSKTCGKCAEVKPQVAFYKDLSSADGLGSWCQQCIQSSLKERLAATAGALQSKPAGARKKPPRATPTVGGASSSSTSSKPPKPSHPQQPPLRARHHAPQPVISGLPGAPEPTPYTSILPAPLTTSFANPLRIRPPPITTPAPPNPSPNPFSIHHPLPSPRASAAARAPPPHSRAHPAHHDHPSQLLSHLSLPFSDAQPPDNLLPDLGELFPDFAADDTLMDLPSYLPPSSVSIFSNPLPTALSLPHLPPHSPVPSPFANAAPAPPARPHTPASEPDSETTHSDVDMGPTPPGSMPPWHLDALDPLPSRMPSLSGGLPRLGSATSHDLPGLHPLAPLTHATSQELQAAVEAVTANTALPPLAPDDFPYADAMDLLPKQ